ncbi:MAG: amidohydrolase [Candidatus Saccharicenans sp.]|jgi:predicted amidohydrolase YtcJ|nr:amidohydrolase [Candidatus Saccharicenans sp.]MDH7574423.1 amidohydrolase [Candidatus Saccharicenans sp.]
MKKTLFKIFLLILSGGLMLTGCQKQGGTMADTILINGHIWTASQSAPEVEALAIVQNRIVKTGTSSEIKRLAGPGTRVLDLQGRLVLPGFIDAHTHFLNGGLALRSVRLRDCRSREEFVSRIAAKARELPAGSWILNGDWDHEQFSPPVLPTREWIDAVTPDHPVCVNRFDGHMVLVNSLALKLAGIDRKTVAPEGGEIVRDPKTGEPTGILKDAAADLVYAVIPAPSLEEKKEAVRIALKEAAVHGVTSIHDMSDASSFEVYQELLSAGQLTARLYVYIQIPEIDSFLRLKIKSGFGHPFLRLAGLKGFVDGSLGSSTALFFEPYSDNPRAYGLLASHMFPEGIMEQRLRQADRAGLQVAIHAIGDRANAILLDMMEKIFAENGPRDRRWRIEHCQHLRRADIDRYGRLGLVASVQPYHAIDDGCWAERKIGPERARTTYAFKSLQQAGAVLVFGSDWTVAPLDPLTGIYAAVTRRTLDDKNPGGWIPEEKITLEEAIRSYTIRAAYAEFSEKEKGSLEPGKLADLVVLDRDLFRIEPEEILKTGVVLTMVDGRIVHSSPDFIFDEKQK